MDILFLDLESYYDTHYSLKKMTTESYINDNRFQLQLIGSKSGEDDTEVVSITDEWSSLDVVRYLRDDLEIPRRAVACFNSNFDGGVLTLRYGVKPKLHIDVMALCRPLFFTHTGVASLDAYVEYTKVGTKGTELSAMKGQTFASADRDTWGRFVEYCRTDVEITKKLFEYAKARWSLVTLREEMALIDLTVRMFTEPVLQLDVPGSESFVLREKNEMEIVLAECDITMKDLRSRPKFAKALEHLGIDPPMKISPTTSKETYAFAKTDEGFRELLNSPDYRVATLANAKLLANSTIKSSRLERLLDMQYRAGAVCVPLIYYGAHTGRYAGTDKINMQNLPPAIRQFIIAPDGYVVMAADLAQIEARMTAVFCEQWDLVELFKAGADVYVEMATTIYHRPAEQITDAQRFVGKTAILGLGYGMGVLRFIAQLKSMSKGAVVMDEGAGKEVVTSYRERFRKIRNTWYRIGDKMDLAARTGQSSKQGHVTITKDGVKLPNDLMIHYKDLTVGDDGLQYRKVMKNATLDRRIYGAKALENIMQSLTGLLMRNYMVTLNTRLKPLGGRIVLQAHDEVVMVVPETRVEDVKRMTTQVMTSPPRWMPQLPLKVEIKHAKRYSDCK